VEHLQQQENNLGTPGTTRGTLRTTGILRNPGLIIFNIMKEKEPPLTEQLKAVFIFVLSAVVFFFVFSGAEQYLDDLKLPRWCEVLSNIIILLFSMAAGGAFFNYYYKLLVKGSQRD
jgi:hypothetical protein